MSKRIIIAGAGHGGLIAAAKLAKAGYIVDLYEQNLIADLGHDWEDRFTFETVLNATRQTSMPEGTWRYRGDCKFVSPSHRTEVLIKYNENTRQKVMWRKSLVQILVDYAKQCGVNFHENVRIEFPIFENNRVVGIKTDKGDFTADLIVDALGVFSPLRTNLPESFNIERNVKRGDVFYAYRAYFDVCEDVKPEYPFEVYLYHECEQGLSWFLTNDDCCDVLIGRIDPVDDNKVEEQLKIFKRNHPQLGSKILHGGCFGIIPVRRPLTVMVANGYAAVGDSAFMTTPMNGMGIDLSIQAGELLAYTVINSKTQNFAVDDLWEYNREFHRLYGGDTAKNEGLKNALLSLPAEGVDFLFDNAVIQSSDLAGAGRNTNLKALLGKFVRGMKNPPYFFAIIKGLIKGAKAAKTYKRAPKVYNRKDVAAWQSKVESYTVKIL